MSDASKRIPVPLLVQTRTDKFALRDMKKALEGALATVETEITRIEEASTEYSTEPGPTGVGAEAYAAYIEALASGRKHLEQTEPNTPLPNVTSQRVLQGSWRIVWNAAIELAAQVTGGAQGTLIRDLKEK